MLTVTTLQQGPAGAFSHGLRVSGQRPAQQVHWRLRGEPGQVAAQDRDLGR